MPTAIIFHCFEFVENLAQIAVQHLLRVGCEGLRGGGCGGGWAPKNAGKTDDEIIRLNRIVYVHVRNIVLCI